MTPLRRRMVEDMKIRNFTGSTQAGYIQCVAAFAEHFGKSPEHLGPEDVRVFLAFLVSGGKIVNRTPSFPPIWKLIFPPPG